MKEYIINFFKKVHEEIKLRTDQDYRLAKYERMLKAGELKNMDTSEFYKIFRISRECKDC